jgi:hypothetical protein
MIGIPQGMQSAFYSFFQHDHSTTHTTPHHTTEQRKEVEFWTANPKKLKKWEIINSQDLKSKPRFRS